MLHTDGAHTPVFESGVRIELGPRGLIKYQQVEPEDILDALELTHTDYVVLSKANPTTVLLNQAGLNIIGETENRVVYRYDLKEPFEFTLVDYSVVY